VTLAKTGAPIAGGVLGAVMALLGAVGIRRRRS
jgi:LPXTG-motif cell wall-anchored protein